MPVTSRLPLAEASTRLRGKPGRPRTRPAATPKADAPATAAVGGIAPRLLDLPAAAKYLGGVSVWTVRDLLDAGRLARVRLPGAGARDLRRVLLDREDLDRLIAQAKDGPA
jgi:hypothetical protein